MEIRKYFAATNSYNGFKSYFGDIFRSSDYDSISVLKGGPGTGKSTFMRKIKESLAAKGAKVDEIYCSSDPDSLDGIIAENSGKRVAMVDGTAPHERDAIIPGAIDEIINLGTNWDCRFLLANKEQILLLNNEKKRSYSAAYFYLKIAGECESRMYADELAMYNTEKLISKAYCLADSVSKNRNSKLKTLLLSSFGKNGKYKLSLENNDYDVIKVEGGDGVKRQFLTYLRDALIRLEEDLIVIPYSLRDTLTDMLILPSSRIIFATEGEGEKYQLTDCINDKTINILEHTRKARQIFTDALIEAERWFKVAADQHSGLEKIYSSCMNFDMNRELCDKKCRELAAILGLD